MVKPSNAGRALASLRRTHSGGDTTVLRPCPYCEGPFGARALRAHIPQCPKRHGSAKAAGKHVGKARVFADAANNGRDASLLAPPKKKR